MNQWTRAGGSTRAIWSVAAALLMSGFIATPTHAAFVLEQWASAAQQDNTVIEATLPGPPTEGNLLVAIVGNRDASDPPATPSGWTLEMGDSGNSPGQLVYYKIAGAAESATFRPGDYSIVSNRGLHLYEYSGVDTANPLANSIKIDGSGTTLATGTINTTEDGSLILAGFTSNASTTADGWTNGFVEEWDFVNGGNPAERSTYIGVSLAAGAAGTYSTSGTTSAAGSWIGHVLVFNPAATAISGTVFEDADFAGTASGWDGGLNDVAQPNVDVELYDAADTYLASTTTAGDGTFSFTGLTDGAYKVRVRSATIGDDDTPPTGGLNPTVPGTWPYPVAELTWANGAALLGGQSATVDDADTGDDLGPGDTWVPVTISGVSVGNVDFGFAYNLIVNTLDDGLADATRSDQGSLRQFIKNANAIGQAAGTTANVSEVRIAGAGPHTVQPTAALPPISDLATLEGDDGSGGRLIVDGTIAGNVDGMRVSSSDVVVRNLVVQNFVGASSYGIRIGDGTTGVTLENCVSRGHAVDGIRVDWLGADTDLNHTIDACTASGNGHDGIVLINADGVVITGSVVENNVRHGINVVGANNGSGNNLFEGNSITGNGSHGVSIWDSGSANNTFQVNVFSGNSGDGIRVGTGGDGTQFYHNTFDNNGTGGSGSGINVNPGVTGVIVRNSLFTNHSHYGVLDNDGGVSTSIDFNGFYANATADCNYDCFTGSQNASVDPLYSPPGPPTSFDLTECASPAVDAGLDLGASQPDLNGSDAGLFNGAAPDIGARESSCATAPNEPPVARDDPGGYASLLASYTPVGWWRLGEGSGPTAVDLGSAANDGTYSSAILGQASGLVNDSDTTMRLDGTGHVEIPHDPAYLIDEGAVQFWFRVPAWPATTDGLFSKDSMNNDTGGHLHVSMEPDGRIEARVQSVGSEATVTSVAPVLVDAWHHVLVSFGAAGLRLYVDGNLTASDPWSSGLGPSSGGAGNFEAIALGASTISSDDLLITPLSGQFTGWMDEVAILSGPVGDADAKALYLTGADRFDAVAGVPLMVVAERGVLRNDTDAEGSPLTASLVSGPANATSFSLAADGGFTYTANPGFNGSDSFVYEAIDGDLATGQATTTIEVSVPQYTIAGVAFEDTDFAGTASAYDGGVTDLGLANVDVELYDAANTYLGSTTTAVDGSYSFTGLADGAYRVRARNATIGDLDTPPAGGLNLTVPGSWPYPVPEMTWGAGAAMLGGQSPITDDADTGDDTGPGDTWVAVAVSSGDVTGVNLGFTYNLIVNTLDDGVADATRSDQGSLRQFIKNSNAIVGTQSSYFQIPVTDAGYDGGGAFWSIKPTVAGPPRIADPVILDAYTQPGASPGTQGFPNALNCVIKVELDGTLLAGSGAPGLLISAGNSTIRGFAIHSFTGVGAHGIDVSTNGGNTIQGNFIGTDVTGTIAHGIGGYALDLGTPANLVGGPAAGDGNIFAASDTYGVWITGSNNVLQGSFVGTDITGTVGFGHSASGLGVISGVDIVIGGVSGAGNLISSNQGNGIWFNSSPINAVVQGNRVGTDITGTLPLGNASSGVMLNSPGTTLGGPGPGEGNLISANFGGVAISSSGHGSIVQGNHIGTEITGAGNLGNVGFGISVATADNLIGGPNANDGNVIANSGADNVVVTTAASGVQILGNSIYGSGAGAGDLGIDIGSDGVSANDVDDSDPLPNPQNYPVLSSVTTDEATTVKLYGSLNSSPSSTFRLEFFASPVADPSGYGEGREFLGSLDVTTDVVGDIGFEATLPRAVAAGQWISATATDPDGNTSEFAANVRAIALATVTISGTVFEDADFAGLASTYDGGATDLGLANVDVELYTDADVHVASATTDAIGNYVFASVADDDYKVRVRSATIGDADTPPAGGLNPTVPGSWPYPVPEMTWGAGTTMIGGQSPTTDDTDIGDDAGPGDCWTPVSISGASVTGVDFGFAYNLIVNTLDDGVADASRSDQGSLRQFIKNANAIGAAALTTASSSHFALPDDDPGHSYYQDDTVAAQLTLGNLAVTAAPDDGAIADIDPDFSKSWWSIRLAAPLPAISDPIVFDGTTQPGFIDTPVVELNGADIGGSSDGLRVTAGASTIRGLVINRATHDGIQLDTAGGNAIVGNYVGTDASGTIALANLVGGIRISSGDNVVGGRGSSDRNLISGNTALGIELAGAGATNNQIIGNFIGTDAGGSSDLANGAWGVIVTAGATANEIGGVASGEGNVIGGHSYGVHLTSSGTSNNIVRGNLIGLDATGTSIIANNNGISISNGATGNTIGGRPAPARNVISGNQTGIDISGAGTTGNLLQGNYIGTDPAGLLELGNTASGVRITDGASGNTVGGTLTGARNLIAGNVASGVLITGTGSDANVVEGNWIGVDASGAVALANHTGVTIADGASSNVVGGSDADAGNVLSGNTWRGVLIDVASSNRVEGNIIGLDATGVSAVSNRIGVYLYQATGNTVGGSTPGSGNTISGHPDFGVYIVDALSTGNVVQGNTIGLDLAKSTPVPNGTSGIEITSAVDNLIGGIAPGEGNAIVGNAGTGISLVGTDPIDNSILSNVIYANGGLGIDLERDGITANDDDDIDSGANEHLNFPVISSVAENLGVVDLEFDLDLPGGFYRIEFFANDSGADPTGYGEGERLVGVATIDHAGLGPQNFSHSFAGAVGDQITATTTECTDGSCTSFDSTSEFSEAATVSAPNDPVAISILIPEGQVLLPGAPAEEVFRMHIVNHALTAASLSALTLVNASAGAGTPEQLDANWETVRLEVDDGLTVAPPATTGPGAVIEASVEAGAISFSGLDVHVAAGDSLDLVVAGSASLGARDGDLLSFNLADPADLVWQEPIDVEIDDPSAPGSGLAVDGMVAAQITVHPVASGILVIGSQRNLALDVSLPQNGYEGDTLDRLNLVQWGSAAPSDLELIEAWVDDGDSLFDPATDLALGTLAFSGSRWELTGIDYPVVQEGLRIFFSVDVDPDASDGGTVQFALPALPDVGIGMVSGNDGPIDEAVANPNALAISSSDRVIIAAIPGSGGTINPGDREVELLRLRLTNTYDVSRLLNRLRVTNASIAASAATTAELDGSFEQVQIRIDGNDDGQLDDISVDPLLASTVFLDGVATFDGLAWNLDPGREVTAFITSSISLAGTADGDDLAVRIERVSDIAFETATAVAARVPLESGATWTVEGMVAAQVDVGEVPTITLAAGEGPALALDLRVPRNGYRNDVLEGLRFSNAGTAVDADFADLRLWLDGGDGFFDAGSGDDRELSALVPVGEGWTSALLNETLGADGARVFVGATASASPTDSATVRFVLDMDGVSVASGNDGPVDGPVASPATLLLSTAPLVADLVFDQDASVVGQMVDVRMTVRNVGTETVNGITPAALTVSGDATLAHLGGPVPASLDLAAGATGMFTWSYRADAVGTAILAGGVEGTGASGGQPRTSQPTTSGPHRVYMPVTALELFPTANMPFSINRGQTGVVPLTLTLRNPGGANASPVRIDALRIALEDELGAGIVPVDLLDRVVVGEGENVYVDRTSLETSGNEIDLTLTQPVVITGLEPVTVGLRLDLSATTVVPAFRVVIADSTWIQGVDSISGSDVAIELQDSTYPIVSGLGRLAEQALRLEVAAVASGFVRVGPGQSGVELLRLDLENPGIDQLSADVEVGSITVSLEDTLGVPVATLATWVERLFVESAGQRITDFVVDPGLASATLEFSPPVVVPVNSTRTIAISGEVAETATSGSFRMRSATSGSLDARDGNTRTPVPVVANPDPLRGGAIIVESPATELFAFGTPGLPSVVGLGSVDVTSMRITLRHPGSAGTAAITVRALTLRCRDEGQAPLVPNTTLDAVRIVTGGRVAAAATDLPVTTDPVTILLDDVSLEPDEQIALDVIVDIEATAPATGLELVVDSEDIDAVDANLGTGVTPRPDTGASFPMTSGVARLAPPADALVVAMDDRMPAALAVQPTSTHLADLRLLNPASSGVGAVPVASLRLRAADADFSAVPIGAAVVRIEAHRGGEIWAQSGDLAADASVANLVGVTEINVEPGEEVTLELVAILRSDPAIGGFRLGVEADDIGVVQPMGALLTIRVEPEAGQSFPMWTDVGNFTVMALDGSYSNFPNPFAAGREATTFVYALSEAATVTLRIYTGRGEIVRTLVDGASRVAGLHQDDMWDGRNGRGNTVVNGVYVAELVVDFGGGGSERVLRKVAVVR